MAVNGGHFVTGKKNTGRDRKVVSKFDADAEHENHTRKIYRTRDLKNT